MVLLFSQQGIDAFGDHDGDGVADDGVTTDCIDQATEMLNLYCQQYSVTGLAASKLVNRWCTVLAVFYLCERRGNQPPDSLQAEYERIIATLEAIHQGRIRLRVAMNVNTSPSFSNMTIDRRWPFSRVRVVPQSSDGIATVLTQKRADEIPTPNG